MVPELGRASLKMTWTLSGASKSAVRTGLQMGPFNLDMGHSVFHTWHAVLLSHGHGDHIFSVGSLFFVDQSVDKKGRPLERYVFAERKTLARVRRYAGALMQLNFETDSKLGLPATFVSADVKPDDEPYVVNINKDIFHVVVRKLSHRVTSVGYYVSKTSTNLNEEFRLLKAQMTTKEFGVLVKKSRALGMGVTKTTAVPQFCFMTDTTIKGIRDNMDLACRYPIIICECTFYHIDDIDHAERKSHTHWTTLLPHILATPNSLWVLIHSSTRYTYLEDVFSAVASTGTEIPSNCLVWLADKPT